MTTDTLDTTQLPAALERAQEQAQTQGLSYSGGVSPAEAWALVQAGQAVLVDVRSAEERKYVGHVPESLHVPWATGTALTRNPRFVRELEARLAKDGGKDAVVLLLCRSGKRSVLAAQAAAAAGFAHVFNVLEGFEGEIDALQQRGKDDGWRFHGLPWSQD
jgi:rhodanese-related sulfurtransferase